MASPRKVITQRDLSGGLNTTSDILHGKPSQLLSAKNMVVSKPNPYSGGTTTTGSLVSSPPLNLYNREGHNFAVPYSRFRRDCVACFDTTLYPNETWELGSGATQVAAISVGNQAINLVQSSGLSQAFCNNPGGGNTATMVSNASWSYYMDVKTNSISGSVTCDVFIGTDSSNYYIYRFTPVSGSNTVEINSLSGLVVKVGNPSGKVKYVQVETYGTGSSNITFDNLRLSPASSVTDVATYTTDLYKAFSFVDSSTNTGAGFVFTANDGVFYGSLRSEIICVRAGLDYAAPSFSDVRYRRACFCSVPKSTDTSKNILVFANGVITGNSGVSTYDPNASLGSRWASITDTNYRLCCTHKNMLFLSGLITDPDMVAPSRIDDFFTFDTDSRITLPTQKSTPDPGVTALVSMDDYLVIGRNRDIYNLFGSNSDSTVGDLVLKQSKSTVGPVTQDACVRVGNFLYFYDGYDIYKYDGNDSVSVTNGRVSDLLNNVNAAEETRTRNDTVSLSYNAARSLLLVHVPTYSGSHPYTQFTTLTYDIERDAWGVMGGDNDDSSVVWSSITDMDVASHINFGKRIYAVDLSPNYSGPGFSTAASKDCSFQHQFHTAGAPGIMKDFERYILYVRDFDSQTQPNNAQIDFYINGDVSRAAFSTTASPVGGKIDVLLAGCTGDSISCKLTKSITDPINDAIEVSGFTMVVNPAEEL